MLTLLHANAVFANDFQVLRPLREGGMGAVYVVRQLSTGSLRALKLMHPQLVRDERLRQRFAQEARLGAMIASDHVVQVIGAGIDAASGTPWLCMELLEGGDLAAVVARRGRLTAAELREVMAQTCHALGAAHALGVVHRDLKPENVFLSFARREGLPFSAKVLDFGIAKLLAETGAGGPTAALGTPLWMAPEQTTPGRAVTPAADVWALGLLAFYLLTGGSYWRTARDREASVPMLLHEILLGPIELASARAREFGYQRPLPPGFDAWFARCVHRDVTARYPDAYAARAELDRIFASCPRDDDGRLPPLSWALRPGDTQLATDPAHARTPTPAAYSAPAPSPAPPFATVAATPAIYYALPATELAATRATPAHLATVAGTMASGPWLQSPTPVALPVAHPLRPRGGSTRSSPKAMLVAVGFLGLFALSLAAVGAWAGARWLGARAARLACDAPEAPGRYEACADACSRGSAAYCTSAGEVRLSASGDAPPDGDAARALFEKACEGGDMAGCARLGELYEDGIYGAARDAGRALALYRRACDGGNARGCGALGELLLWGGSVPRDAGAALPLVRKALEGGDERARQNLTAAHFFGNGTPRDEAAALALARAGCERGYAYSCGELGYFLAFGLGTAPDAPAASAAYEKALQGYEGRCSGAEPLACQELGYLRANGRGGRRDYEKALTAFRRGCETGGRAQACVEQGWLLSRGLGAPKDEARARELFQDACDRGEHEGCMGLAGALGRRNSDAQAKAEAAEQRAYDLAKGRCDRGHAADCVPAARYLGWGFVAPDPAKRLALLEGACEANRPEACDQLATALRESDAANAPRAAALFDKSCRFGSHDGCVHLGNALLNGDGLPKDEARAVSLYQRMCDLNSGEGCYRLGFLRATGRAVAKDDGQANELYTRACDLGHYDGCSAFGLRLQEGRGAVMDKRAAVSYFERACDAVNMNGCYNLAHSLRRGEGIAKDVTRATELFDRACQMRNKSACLSLGIVYREEPTKKNPARALEALQRASDLGNGQAGLELWDMYTRGDGVPRDRAKALAAARRGCGFGYDLACKAASLGTAPAAPAAPRNPWAAY